MSTNHLTIRHLMTAFAVGHMSIYNWRHGTPTKAALPHRTLDDGHIVFNRAAVEKWAAKHDVKIVVPFDKITEKNLVPFGGAKELEAKPKAKKVAKKAAKPAPKAKPKAKKAKPVEAASKPRSRSRTAKKPSTPPAPSTESQPAASA